MCSKEAIDAAHFSPDAAEFLWLLHTHGVRYLLIGGEAVMISPVHGAVPIFYMGKKQLIKNKKAAARPKDLDDIPYLTDEA